MHPLIPVWPGAWLLAALGFLPILRQHKGVVTKMIEAGLQQLMRGDLDGARRTFQKAVKKQPRNPHAYSLLGVVALQTDNLAHAAEHFRRAIALDDTNPGFHNNLGEALKRSGAIGPAVRCFQKALQLAPGEPDFLNNLGTALQTMNQLDEAEAALSQALGRKPSDPEFLHNFGVLLQEQGRIEDAIRHYETALDINPKQVATLTSMASAYTDLEDKERAIALCRQVVEIDPLYLAAHEHFKIIHWDLGKPEKMNDLFYRSCELLPDSYEAHCNLGSALIDSRFYDAAEPPLEKATQLDQRPAKAFALLGRALNEMGRRDQSVEALERAIRLNGDDGYTFEALGLSYMDMGEHSKAVDALLRAHKLEPRRSSFLGMLTIAMNEAEDARVNKFVDYGTYVTERLIDVPDGFTSLDEFNVALHEELAAQHKDRPPPIGQTLEGGTQIPGNMFHHPTGLTAVLCQQITKAISEYIASLKPDKRHPFLRFLNPDFRFTGAWSTIIQGSGYDGSHIHNEGWLSGVYYIKVPGIPEEKWDAGEGCIQFGEPPKHFASERNATERLIRPQPGKLALFPSFYWHGVRPFTDRGTRHAMAFDVI